MPAETQPLLDFIDAAKNRGASDEFVVALLRQNGWSEKRVYQAFSAWALLFTAINRAFPNPALDYSYGAYATRGMANQLASIIVAFPLFLLVSWGIVRGAGRQPERLESAVRKWLTWLALVVTASTMIGDIVMFLAYFLRGDLDTRFVLEVLTVLVIAGGIFAYYVDSLRRERISRARNRLFAAAALAAAVFGIVVGFVQLGSPALQRSISQDARRLFDLSTLAQGQHTRWLALTREQREFRLPATIADLQATRSDAGIVDPVTGIAYEYRPAGGTEYILCAAFAAPSDANVPARWRHPQGHACFTLDASRSVAVMPRVW
jgi:hypothetical protein